MDKWFIRIFVSVFGSIGLIFLGVAVFSFRSESDQRRGAIRVPGRIVDLEPTKGSRGGTLYKPVFEFYDNQDRKHMGIGSVASSPPSYSRGEEVTVLYRPENPENAQLDSFLEAWFMPLIFGFLGSVFSSIAGGIIIAGIRRRSKHHYEDPKAAIRQ